MRVLALLSIVLAPALAGGGCGSPPPSGEARSPAVSREAFAGERHLANLRQLTFGGQNAEAYWSNDGRRLVFQSTRDGREVDAIYVMDDDGSNVRRVSSGEGRTTCAFFLPGDRRILYASTHGAGPEPPPPPPHDPALGYVWPVYRAYDIYTAQDDGSDVRLLAASPGYDAEATVSPRGDRIVFTSSRDGDLELYSMALDGSDVRRLTERPGYDGGAWYSPDGARLVWRAPPDEAIDAEEAHALLERELVRPTRLEIFVADADGGNRRKITHDGVADFAPAWHPDGRHVIFASNQGDPERSNFDLWLVDVETGAEEQVTFFAHKREGERRSDDFDGFPMFSPDGKRLVFCSNRFNEEAHETNVFVCDWVP